jgi:hypothetical protein
VCHGSKSLNILLLNVSPADQGRAIEPAHDRAKIRLQAVEVARIVSKRGVEPQRHPLLTSNALQAAARGGEQQEAERREGRRQTGLTTIGRRPSERSERIRQVMSAAGLIKGSCGPYARPC